MGKNGGIRRYPENWILPRLASPSPPFQSPRMAGGPTASAAAAPPFTAPAPPSPCADSPGSCLFSSRQSVPLELVPNLRGRGNGSAFGRCVRDASDRGLVLISAVGAGHEQRNTELGYTPVTQPYGHGLESQHIVLTCWGRGPGGRGAPPCRGGKKLSTGRAGGFTGPKGRVLISRWACAGPSTRALRPGYCLVTPGGGG